MHSLLLFCENMKQLTYLLFLSVALSLFACEESVDTPISTVRQNDEVWVEGFIEAYTQNQGTADEERRPAYVFIRETIAPDRSYSIEELEDIFVKGAIVEITGSDGQEVELASICLDDFVGGSRQDIVEDFDLDQIEIPSIGVRADTINFCLYIDARSELIPRIGETYDLKITLRDGREISASTSIPEHVPIDSFYYVSPFVDTTFATSLKQMRIVIDDPDTLKSYFRYFTKINDESFIPGFDSVIDDVIFDGFVSDYPLPKGEPRAITTNTGGNLFGNYRSGDDVTIKWCNIDEAHYAFWDSFEFNLDNSGIFSSYIGTEWNVEGALGIWGGYSVSFYRDTVPQ